MHIHFVFSASLPQQETFAGVSKVVPHIVCHKNAFSHFLFIHLLRSLLTKLFACLLYQSELFKVVHHPANRNFLEFQFHFKELKAFVSDFFNIEMSDIGLSWLTVANMHTRSTICFQGEPQYAKQVGPDWRQERSFRHRFNSICAPLSAGPGDGSTRGLAI